MTADRERGLEQGSHSSSGDAGAVVDVDHADFGSSPTDAANYAGTASSAGAHLAAGIPDSVDTATGEIAPSEISTERVYEVFSSIASSYERFNVLSSLGMCRKWLNTMVSMAPIDPTSEVLDVAGGTGDVSFAIARRKPPARILCTDLVPEMLDIARSHVERDSANCGVLIEFQVVDAQDMPIPDASFDVVTMAYGIRNMPKRRLALAEILRVLRPGGSLVCLEFSTPSNSIWRGLYTFYLNHMIPLWGKIITGNREGFVYLGDSIRAFPDQQGFAGLLTDVGFEAVVWKNCSGGIAAVHVARRPL